MGHNKIDNSTDFYYYFFRNVLLIGFPLLIISTLVLSSIHSSATGSGSGTDNLTISISSACTLSSVVDIEHSTNTNVGTYTSDIGKTTITTLCNDGNGYSVYAVGYSNNEEGNNKLINSERPEYSIDTGLATSGLTSAWAIKLNNIPNDPSPTPPTIEQDYNNTYGLVPTQWTKVAGRTSGTTDMSQGSSLTTTYSVYAASSQYAGTYLGQVRYLLTHPATTDTYLFMQDAVAIKNNLPNEGDSMQVIDKRDGKKYWVTRLADGNIWMTQNLDLDLSSSVTLTSNNTDLNVYNASGYTNGYTTNNGVIYWTPSSAANTINFTGTTVSGWQNSNTAPYSANKTDDTSTGHKSLGNYYNWTAAIASNNSGTLSSNTLNDISQNPKNSICPKGWRLPTISSDSASTAGSTNEFARLNYLYNSLSIAPLYFMLYGYTFSSTLGDYKSKGHYHSSTIVSDTQAFYLGLQSSNIDAQTKGSRSSGRSVRCVTR